MKFRVFVISWSNDLRLFRNYHCHHEASNFPPSSRPSHVKLQTPSESENWSVMKMISKRLLNLHTRNPFYTHEKPFSHPQHIIALSLYPSIGNDWNESFWKLIKALSAKRLRGRSNRKLSTHMENDHKFITRKFKHSLNVVFNLISEKMRFPVRNSFANNDEARTKRGWKFIWFHWLWT